MKPTNVTMTIRNQFNQLAPRALFTIGTVSSSVSSYVNTEDNGIISHDQATANCAQTHTLEFSVIFDEGSDTYIWSFSHRDNSSSSQ